MGEFVDAPGMAVACKGHRQEGRNAGAGLLDTDQARAQGDDVGVIMLARKLRREDLRNQRATRGGVAVDRDRNADARSAQRDAPGRFTRGR